MAGTPAGYSALPTIALLKAWPKRTSGRAVNTATQSEADLQLWQIARRQQAAAANPHHLRGVGGSAPGHFDPFPPPRANGGCPVS